MNNKVLLITSCFAPENVIGAVRVTKIVKYLVRMGYEVTVVAPELHELSKIDDSLVTSKIKQVKVYRVSQSEWFKKTFLRRRNKMLKKKSATGYMNSKKGDSKFAVFKSFVFIHLQFMFSIIRDLDWKKKSVAFIKNNFSKSEFDIVLSSYPDLSTHWCANWVRKNEIAKVWFADFRDPINYEVNSSALKLGVNTYFQNKVLSQADYSMCISKDLFKKFNSKYHYKLKYLPNGFDEDDLHKEQNKGEQEYNENRKFTFCYVGSLYGGERSLKSFFKALSLLIETNKISKEDIKIVYAGKEFAELEKQAKLFNLETVLENRGLVSRLESIKIQDESDIILVVTWNTEKDQGILTGKLFECFLTQKTILGIVNGTVPNSEFKQIITDVNGGYAFEDSTENYTENFQELQSFLHKKFIQQQQNGKVSSNYNEKLANFNYKNITKQLVDFFNEGLVAVKRSKSK